MDLPELLDDRFLLLNRFLSLKKESTADRYNFIIRRMFSFTGELFFDDAVQLASFIAGLESSGTKKLYLSVFKSWLSFLSDEGIKIGFPFKIHYKTRVLSKNILSKEECQWFMDNDLFFVLIKTGMRVSELCEFREEFISNGFLTIKGKGDRYRLIPISDETVMRLLKVKKQSRYSYFRQIKNLGKTIGIDLCPHAIRATACTLLLQAGNDVMEVARWMGHSNTNTTLLYDYRKSTLEVNI